MHNSDPIRIDQYRASRARAIAAPVSSEEAYRQFKASVILLAIIASGCLTATVATVLQLG